MKREITQGAKCLTPKKVCEKLSRGKSWLWLQIKQDKDFPRPIYISGRPVFIEQELDAYIAAKAAQ